MALEGIKKEILMKSGSIQPILFKASSSIKAHQIESKTTTNHITYRHTNQKQRRKHQMTTRTPILNN